MKTTETSKDEETIEIKTKSSIYNTRFFFKRTKIQN
jgi:hypothetical protein